MIVSVPVKLLPTPEQSAAMLETLELCNEAATWIATRAFETKTFNRTALHHLVYSEARERFSLGSTATTATIGRIFAHRAALKARLVRFAKHGTISINRGMVTLNKDHVTIWTTRGRLRVPVSVLGKTADRLNSRKSDARLQYRGGKWFVVFACDVAEAPASNPEGWLGVDLGIVNIAADSDGHVYTGADIEKYRDRLARRRAGLQKRGTKAAKRRLRKLSGKQGRYQKHVNHCISKALVATAERTGRGLALEDLKGIRERVTAPRSRRARLNNWTFGQLRNHLTYKAAIAGVPLVLVDRRYTSQMCSCCGHTDKANRPNQSTFKCISCGHTEPADLNAARNIRARAALATPLSSQAAQAS
jgi:putative transposase